MEEIMTRMSNILRWSIVPALAVIVALSAMGTHGAWAEQEMSSMTVMLPAMPGSSADMLSITVRMPASMASEAQPQIRRIPGVGYEIDYGGPSILIERLGQD